MSKYHNDNSYASDPGQLRLAPALFRRLEPSAQGVHGWIGRQFGKEAQFEEMLDEHLRLGDSRAACVLSLDPLLVAAYTDELDCVAVLAFPAWLVAEHRLQVGTRLLTVNTYSQGMLVAPDLTPGPEDTGSFINFFPVIADFVTTDPARLQACKARIGEAEWQRCENQGREYLQRSRGPWRNGSPRHSAQPAGTQHQTPERMPDPPAGVVVRLTPAAVAELRRIAVGQPCIVQVGCETNGVAFRHTFDLVDGNRPCIASWMQDGIRIQVPDKLSAALLEGTVVDFVASAGQHGFKFHNPNAQKSP